MTAPQKFETLSILKNLVRFDTTSFKSNLDLIDYVATLFSSHGIQPEIIYDRNGQKANLLARVGPAAIPGIVLSGHTDVVPVAGQQWQSDPFELIIRDEKVFGRGTCDMKGFIASALAILPKLAHQELSKPVYFSLSYDEEVGCTGVHSVLDFLKAKGIKIDACIIGEPSSMKPVTAHTGKQVYRCTFHGTPMHSSLAPEGINAISMAGDAIAHINDLSKRAEEEKTHDRRFAHPHPTINIGTIEGGKAVNIVAENCSFNVEMRYPPGTSYAFFSQGLPDFIEKSIHFPMVEANPDAYAHCEQIVEYPSYQAEADSASVQLVRRLTGANEELAVNFGTEAGLFQKSGYSSVVCGPGDIQQAHQPDEYIELSQLTACDHFMQSLVNELTSDRGPQ